jgi:hypothetical protein
MYRTRTAIITGGRYGGIPSQKLGKLMITITKGEKKEEKKQEYSCHTR